MKFGSSFACGLLFVSALSVSTISAQVEGPVNTRVIARAEVKGDAQAPVLQASTVRVNVAGRDVPVGSVTPLIGTQGLQGPVGGRLTEVAVVLDDGLRFNFDTNLKEVVAFVRGLASPTVSVGLGYMQNGSVVFGSGFSTDPDTVAKSARLPLGVGGVSASPYFCVQDLIKHWPTTTGAPHVILMITNGIDPYNGSVSPLNQDSPYVLNTITTAQKAGVPVYSIYFGGRGVNGLYSSASGQGYLAQLADGTGAETYNQGQITPPSITPFLKQFTEALNHSYDLVFQDSGKGLQRLKVSAPGVKLKAQSEVEAGTGLTQRGER